ncbi:hypothetical protein [Paenibacillus illinoisensis]|uniref:hypothetical protein n=1 Tax=Paenibacillus illinoisensis TaxID=59845 RepID=UPI001C8D176B|nr:hypothetical protein [Paenibacillus illinoisensis]MBY0217834.1 hypothetical protein [Paenibacillus illinoisensis]
MGSSGTGSFGDLHTPSTSELCLIAIKEALLEEVSLSTFYKNNNSVPEKGHYVEVSDSTVNGRIVVISTSTMDIIGLLPSRYSYLLGCMKKGHKYIGKVVFSGVSPIPKVMVNLDAN